MKKSFNVIEACLIHVCFAELTNYMKWRTAFWGQDFGYHSTYEWKNVFSRPGTRSAGTSSSSMSVHWTLVTLLVWMLVPCPESPAYGLGNLLRNAICVSDILMHFFLHFEKFPRVKVVWQSCSLLKLVEPVVPLSCWDTKALSEECNTHNADKLFMVWNGLKSRPSRNLLKGHFVHPPLIEC